MALADQNMDVSGRRSWPLTGMDTMSQIGLSKETAGQAQNCLLAHGIHADIRSEGVKR